MALFHRPNMPLAEEEAPESISEPFDPRSAGDELRQRREALGLGLADVAATLRIKPAYLAALEAERPGELPGAVYAIGFLRAYADHLGLDGAEMVRRFKRESVLFPARPELAFPIRLGERSTPGGGVLLVALILATCAYGAWFYVSTGEGPRRERVAEVPLELLPSPGASLTPPAGSRPTESQAQAAPRSRPAPSEVSEYSGTSEAGSGSAGRPAVAGPAVTAAPKPAPAAATNPAQNAPKGVVIKATANSWIQIRDARHSVILTRVLKAGESCQVPDRPGLSMRTGNAGVLEITVDGSPAPPIGRVGMVRRDVALDAQALRTGSAVHN
jgi:cytoskeleton protein RodZ